MSLALMRVMHVPRSRCRSIRPTRMTLKVWRRSCARDGTVESFEAHHARALLAARSQLVGPRPLYRGFKSMTFWHGFASLPCSIPDGNGYRPRFKPVSVGSIRQYISQLLLARTTRGMCGCASGLARQSPDRQQSIDRDPGRGSPYESQVPCAPQRAAGGARVPRAYPSEPYILSFPAKCRYATGA